MELRRRLRVATRWLWLVALFAAIGAGTALFLSLRTAPLYSSSAKLLVDIVSSPSGAAGDMLVDERVLYTYADLAQSRQVLDKVASSLQLSEATTRLEDRVRVTAIRATQLLQVTAEANSATLARDIANKVSEVFVEASGELQRGLLQYGLTIAESAGLSPSPLRPQPITDGLLGAGAGLAFGLCLTFLLHHLDNTVKTPADVREAVSLPTLAEIQRHRIDKSEKLKLICELYPMSRETEAFRVLRSNIGFAAVDKPLKTLLLTSAGAGEGKSTLAANLACVFAQAGNRTIVIDADLRRPTQHRMFGVANDVGLTNLLLTSDSDVASALQTVGIDRIRLLSSGPLPPNPSELSASQRFSRVLAAVAKMADKVIVDAPAYLAASDAAVLASKVDGVVLVVRAGKTSSQALQHVVASVDQANRTHGVLGVVLNMVRDRGGDDSRYFPKGYRYSRADGSAPGRIGRQEAEGKGT